ncbi:hypothetical protein SS1G_10702 [Sclerotinia sclerotiorum 1980 UF-70]|uniref:DUF2470 domain-containing protein n=2 Tax=Sclerotinia sclerotiorum (strain ATCC 18683 / 1980 / Ss-1) TaxID=665079 RepID=A7EZD5_SCLS1|nr:hypothetical protein SS1G_10702 [Sclerotinia sclerotiorum 1980 UF-70]APA12285.1 hypothetical protein sscle_09g070550 [Sclerotinia sclerotiorum 1980 UF-70]EDN94827.1 hypothetical protein SS1G_10702 [Sclerotinia sclerotiorum 1980 UF-70]
MASSSEKDAAIKKRILTHMNADHASSLSFYLRHYCQLSKNEASNPKLLDISLSSLTISSKSGKSHTIPIDPPLSSYSDARPRFVAMDTQSRTALDISPHTITRYEAPKTFVHRLIFGACLMTIVIFVTQSHIVPGTYFYDNVLRWFPGGAATFVWISAKIAIPTIVIHVAEAFWMDRSRLMKYNVQRGSSVWWKWMTSCLIEGIGSFARVDAMIKQQKKEQESKGNGGH